MNTIIIDDELKAHLEEMCQFARTVAPQFGAENFNATLAQFKSIIAVNQWATTESHLQVANRLINQLEAKTDTDEEQRELVKALLVLAASIMAGLVDEEFNIIL